MTVPASFDDWMRNVQSTMEESLSSLLPEGKLASSSLHESMRYAVLDGGKRIRPLLVFATGYLSMPKSLHWPGLLQLSK